MVKKHTDKKNAKVTKRAKNYLPLPAALLFLFFVTGSSLFGYERRDAIVTAVEKISPAVVNVSSEYEVTASPFSAFGANPLFESFFRDFFDEDFERRYKKNSLGSGVIIDGKRGFVLTNAHVIEKTGTVTVALKDEREFKAQIVGADPDSDLAVLRISSQDTLPSVEMGNSDDLMIGETVIAIGNPFGFSNTVTAGVISALNRSIRTEDRIYNDFIQTDASINPGNSGGPLLNINGELIGINTAIYAKAQGIGFAIPISRARRIVSDLIRYGEVSQAWIGLSVQDIDARLARYLKLPREAKGVMAVAVEPDSPAEKAGIREGDIVVSVGSTKIYSGDDYYTAVRAYSAGDTVKMSFMREAATLNAAIQSLEFPMERAEELAFRLIGIRVKNFAPKNSSAASKGVIISEVRPRSYIADIGAKPGDMIRQIDDMTVTDTKDFEKAVVKSRNKASAVLLLQRGGQGYYITVRLQRG